jgi:hypothetical protein
LNCYFTFKIFSLFKKMIISLVYRLFLHCLKLSFLIVGRTVWHFWKFSLSKNSCYMIGKSVTVTWQNKQWLNYKYTTLKSLNNFSGWINPRDHFYVSVKLLYWLKNFKDFNFSNVLKFLCAPLVHTSFNHNFNYQ